MKATLTQSSKKTNQSNNYLITENIEIKLHLLIMWNGCLNIIDINKI